MRTKIGVKSVGMAIIALLLLTGCASFPRNQLPPVGSFQPLPEGTKKPTVAYSFSSGVDLFGKQEHRENVRAQLEREFVDVLNESGYFASLSQGNQGEISIQARLVNSGTPAVIIPAIITGLSLYTIPSWATDNYDVTAKVTAQDGKEHTYQLTDSMTTVQWLPMIVVAPFKKMVNVSKDVRRNIWKNLILKMQEDGVLPKHETIGATTSSLNIQFKWTEAA